MGCKGSKASQAATAPTVGERHLGVDVKRVHALKHGVLVISSGSVTDFVGSAIVNAANEGCVEGGGADRAVNAAGGPKLRAAREALPEVKYGVRCPTGDAKITVGGGLKAKYCIHAVGPMYAKCSSIPQGDSLLAAAYKAAMQRAQEKSLATLGFSLISSGMFRGPQTSRNVMRIAVETLVSSAYPGLEEVHLIAFSAEELSDLLSICDELFEPQAAGEAPTLLAGAAAEPGKLAAAVPAAQVPSAAADEPSAVAKTPDAAGESTEGELPSATPAAAGAELGAGSSAEGEPPCAGARLRGERRWIVDL